VHTATKAPNATELWRQWWTAGESDLTQMWRPWLDYFETWQSSMRPSKHRAHGDCGCDDACSCCVPDAEIVVHARAGERRIVPFELANHTRREKEVRVATGDWTHCSGPELRVETDLDAPENFTLEPCASRVVRMAITIAAAEQGVRKMGTGDVDACASAYTDVRFEGCARPIRVAVVVHPSACDPYEVTCDCGCC
jgi:hypothetical protein